MNRRDFFRRAPLGALAIIATPSILERFRSSVGRDLQLERLIAPAKAWCAKNGWALKLEHPREFPLLLTARKFWRLGDAEDLEYRAAFSVSVLTKTIGGPRAAQMVLNQVRYGAAKKEQAVERIRAFRREHGWWPAIDERGTVHRSSLHVATDSHGREYWLV